MSDVRLLIVDGVTVPVFASTTISQTYDKQSATYRSRMRSGTLKQRKVWPSGGAKLITTITGSGMIPPGIGEDGLVDYDNSFVLSCVGHRAITSTSNVIALPAARRSDSGSEPYARVRVAGTDKWVPTAVSVVGNTATLTTVTGAAQYQCLYFPEITVFADPPTEEKPRHGPEFSWTLVAEEI